jgi:hypothetical protein
VTADIGHRVRKTSRRMADGREIKARPRQAAVTAGAPERPPLSRQLDCLARFATLKRDRSAPLGDVRPPEGHLPKTAVGGILAQRISCVLRRGEPIARRLRVPADRLSPGSRELKHPVRLPDCLIREVRLELICGRSREPLADRTALRRQHMEPGVLGQADPLRFPHAAE